MRDLVKSEIEVGHVAARPQPDLEFHDSPPGSVRVYPMKASIPPAMWRTFRMRSRSMFEMVAIDFVGDYDGISVELLEICEVGQFSMPIKAQTLNEPSVKLLLGRPGLVVFDKLMPSGDLKLILRNTTDVQKDFTIKICGKT